MNKIVQLLHDRGPSLSSDIAAILRQAGKSPEAARQIVSRLPEEVRVLHGLPFPKRARFIYLQQQFATDRYWDALTSAIDNANPAYSAALAGVRSRGGCVPSRRISIRLRALPSNKRARSQAAQSLSASVPLISYPGPRSTASENASCWPGRPSIQLR